MDRILEDLNAQLLTMVDGLIQNYLFVGQQLELSSPGLETIMSARVVSNSKNLSCTNNGLMNTAIKFLNLKICTEMFYQFVNILLSFATNLYNFSMTSFSKIPLMDHLYVVPFSSLPQMISPCSTTKNILSRTNFLWEMICLLPLSPNLRFTMELTIKESVMSIYHQLEHKIQKSVEIGIFTRITLSLFQRSMKEGQQSEILTPTLTLLAVTSTSSFPYLLEKELSFLL